MGEGARVRFRGAAVRVSPCPVRVSPCSSLGSGRTPQRAELAEELLQRRPQRSHLLPPPPLQRALADQHRPQPVHIRMQILLRRRDRPVPQKELDLADVHALLQQVGGDAVA